MQPQHEVLKSLPSVDAHLQFPVKILQERIRRSDLRSMAQVLLRWSGEDASSATWEEKDLLRQLFPRASAWGQAGSQEGANVTADREGRTRPLEQNPTVPASA